MHVLSYDFKNVIYSVCTRDWKILNIRSRYFLFQSHDTFVYWDPGTSSSPTNHFEKNFLFVTLSRPYLCVLNWPVRPTHILSPCLQRPSPSWGRILPFPTSSNLFGFFPNYPTILSVFSFTSSSAQTVSSLLWLIHPRTSGTLLIFSRILVTIWGACN